MVNIKDFQKKLSELAYRVCVNAETEPPFSGKYVHPGHEGVFLCVGCQRALFYAQDQYDSNSGWPSFMCPYDEDVVEYVEDHSNGMNRVEVRCASCHSHLGHVFDDGPGPTNLRYCINSVALILENELGKN